MAEKAECIGRYILSTIDSPNVIQALACDTRAHRGGPPPRKRRDSDDDCGQAVSVSIQAAIAQLILRS